MESVLDYNSRPFHEQFEHTGILTPRLHDLSKLSVARTYIRTRMKFSPRGPNGRSLAVKDEVAVLLHPQVEPVVVAPQLLPHLEGVSVAHKRLGHLC